MEKPSEGCFSSCVGFLRSFCCQMLVFSKLGFQRQISSISQTKLSIHSSVKNRIQLFSRIQTSRHTNYQWFCHKVYKIKTFSPSKGLFFVLSNYNFLTWDAVFISSHSTKSHRPNPCEHVDVDLKIISHSHLGNEFVATKCRLHLS